MFSLLEARANHWIDRHTSGFLRRGLGLIFLWFGLLKFCPGLCDVELLAQQTLMLLTLHIFTPQQCIRLLAVWECAMGAILLVTPERTPWGRALLRACAISLALHLCGTFLPLVLFPSETWKAFPYAPTLTGQYILKNVVLMGAALAVYAQSTVRILAAVPHHRQQPHSSQLRA